MSWVAVGNTIEHFFDANFLANSIEFDIPWETADKLRLIEIRLYSRTIWISPLINLMRAGQAQ